MTLADWDSNEPAITGKLNEDVGAILKCLDNLFARYRDELVNLVYGVKKKIKI